VRPDITDTSDFQASYQEALDGGRVRCTVCPHNCTIHEGKAGICRTRLNKKGVLYSLAYGKPCSVSVDPVEKKPLFHFFPGSSIFSIATAGCNFRCLNCQNWTISQSSPSGTSHYSLTPEDIAEAALRQGTDSIAFTYTEPAVFYEYMLEIAKASKEKGMRCVLVSNGYINERPLENLCRFLDGANIDIKCFDDEIYKKLAGGTLQPVLDTLQALKKSGVWLEITNLVIPGWTDDPAIIARMCEWLVSKGFATTPLHFSRFYPNYKLQQIPSTPPASLIKAEEIARKAGMKYIYIGNLHLQGKENTFCPKCGKVLVERDGFYVRSNKIKSASSGKGICGYCGEEIAGVWDT
jgi:pyruvate formate lyase activating enzyme